MRFKAVEHHSGMFAVIDTTTGDTIHLYADEATAQRVAAKSSPRPYRPYTDGPDSPVWQGEAYRYYIETHYTDDDGRTTGDAPEFEHRHPAGPPESPIAWRLTRPNTRYYGSLNRGW
jgi:hypothetical protein